MTKIGIIGAGVCGLAAADVLKKIADVTIFEKSRGVSGRLATRVVEPYQFNHGAQFFTARSKEFKAFLMPFIEQKTVQAWRPKVVTLKKGEKPYSREWFEPHYIALPKMTSLARLMSQGQKINLNSEVQEIVKEEGGWFLITTEGRKDGPFDWLIVTTPAPQAQKLLPISFSEIEILKEVRMLPCFALMVGFKSRWPFAWQAARVKDSKISWISVRSEGDIASLVLHSTNEWAQSNSELSKESAQSCLIQELGELLQRELPKYDFASVHLWRYAAADVTAGCDYLIDSTEKLAACGDWCLGDRVEAAFLSGLRLGQKIASELNAVA